MHPGLGAAVAVVCLLTAPMADARTVDPCQPAGAYHVISKSPRVRAGRIIGLRATVERRDGTLHLDALARGRGDGYDAATTAPLTTGARGRWRVNQAPTEDLPGLRLRLERCERFVGRIKERGRRAERLVAVRSTCGDGAVDRFADEDCEPDGAACTTGTCDHCRCLGVGGRPDRTFGTDGVVTIPGPPSKCVGDGCAYTTVTSIVPRADGSMYVVGVAADPSAPERFGNMVFVDRLRADGTIDPDFRQVVTDGGPPYADVTPDGGLAWAQNASPSASNARRFRSDGTPDPTFVGVPLTRPVFAAAATSDGGVVAIGGDGIITTWAADGSVASAVNLVATIGWRPVAVDDDARVIAMGSDGEHAQLRRFLASGSPDPTFAAGGLVCVAVNPVGTGVFVEALNDGSIVHALRLDTGYRITRVPEDGAGFDATCTTPPATFLAPAIPLVVQADGTYLAYADPGLVRLLADGTVDPEFGRFGRIGVLLGTLALDAQGRILIGTANPDGSTDRIVRRHLP